MTVSTNIIKQQPEIQVRLRNTNHIVIEQSKEAELQQLKVKNLHEEHSDHAEYCKMPGTDTTPTI